MPPFDSDIEAALARLKSMEVPSDSENYSQALQEYEELMNRKAADLFLIEASRTYSPAVLQQRELLIQEVHTLLKQCRSQPAWGSRSEYKLPSWLEHVPENMIPYTSLSKLRGIRNNLTEYLQRHINMHDKG